MKESAPTLWHWIMSFLFALVMAPLFLLDLMLPKSVVLTVFCSVAAVIAVILSGQLAFGGTFGGKVRDSYGITQYEKPLARFGTVGRLLHGIVAIAYTIAAIIVCVHQWA